MTAVVQAEPPLPRLEARHGITDRDAADRLWHLHDPATSEPQTWFVFRWRRALCRALLDRWSAPADPRTIQAGMCADCTAPTTERTNQ